MLVTVVIPTFNRASLLRDSVPLLMNQEVGANTSYEVIFVNNGSDDSTEEVLSAATREYPGKLRYLSIEPSGGPSAPRNAGIRAAKGSVIVILDDDLMPDPDLIQRHAEYHMQFPEKEAAAVGVAYVPKYMKANPVSLFHEFDYRPLRTGGTISYIYFWTCNLSIKRDFMLDYGMFDERYLYNEDLVCGHRLAGHGLQLRFCESARGQHIHQLKLEDAPTKGTFIGRWIWATTQAIPEPEILDRYGVLSMRLGFWRYSKRLLNRMAFPLLDNIVARAILRQLGAQSGVRSRVSDIYYYVAYRKKILAGYREAKQAAKRCRRDGLVLEPCELVRSLPG